MSQTRERLIEYLGGVCVHKGCLVRDAHALQLDHRENDGFKDRRRFDSPEEMYQYYWHHLDKAREKLQVLCANHNMKKRYGELRTQDWSDALVKGVMNNGLTERFIYG